MKIETELKKLDKNFRESSVMFSDVHMTQGEMEVTIESILEAFYYKYRIETLIAIKNFMEGLEVELEKDDDE